MGLTPDIHKVILDLSDISTHIEAYCAGNLIKPDLQILLSKKNAIHHALLSLPTADEALIPERDRGVYECCRLGGILYSTAVLFPLPKSTGTLPRIASMVRTAVEGFRLETCFEGGGKVLIWILLLGGIAAEGTLERVWFLRRLKPLLAMEGITSWTSLNGLVARFLWMESACADGALKVWEELRQPPFL
jgi:hypothetical protein